MEKTTTRLFSVLIILLMLSGCSALRKVAKDSTEIKAEIKTEQTKTADVSFEKRNNETVTAITDVTETIDTCIMVQDPKTGLPLIVPVKLNRTIHKQEYKKNQDVTNATGHQTENVNTQASQAIKEKTKSVETKGQPWAMWITLAASALLILLFVFLWHKFKLGSVFSRFSSKRPS